MKTHCFLFVLALCALIVSPSLSEAQTKPSPIVSYVTVGEVAATEYIPLPVIDWGGEYAQLYANGGAKKTKPDSILGRYGLKFELWRENDPKKQLDAYLSGKTPYFRGTFDMVMNVVSTMNKDLRTKPVMFVVLTRSTGGDTVVVTPNIKTVADFKGKRIGIQVGGPHLYYLWSLLKLGGLKLSDVKIEWHKDLSGPAQLMRQKKVDIAFCIIPDALELTQGGGAEGSVAGSRILLSTKTMDKVIFDVYVVRSDYFESHKQEVTKLTMGLLKAQDELVELFKKKNSSECKSLARAFSQIILGGEQPVNVAEEMIMDFTFARLALNESFFTGKQFPTFSAVLAEINTAFDDYEISKSPETLVSANWNYGQLKSGALLALEAEKPRFDENKVAAVVKEQQLKGTLEEGQLFPVYSIYFAPNQTNFSASQYYEAYDKIINYLQKLGGAAVIIEGHSDPTNYLQKKKAGEAYVVLSQIKQTALNLSMQRAFQVRQSIIEYAKTKGITLDKSQFNELGHGIEKPKTGMCGGDPCYPKDKNEWLSNIRVDFRVIQLEAEAVEYKPL